MPTIPHWQPTCNIIECLIVWSFMRVAYIHNAGYIGGLVGLLLTYPSYSNRERFATRTPLMQFSWFVGRAGASDLYFQK